MKPRSSNHKIVVWLNIYDKYKIIVMVYNPYEKFIWLYYSQSIQNNHLSIENIESIYEIFTFYWDNFVYYHNI